MSECAKTDDWWGEVSWGPLAVILLSVQWRQAGPACTARRDLCTQVYKPRI